MSLRCLARLRFPGHLWPACGLAVVRTAQVEGFKGWCSAAPDAAAVETRSAWTGASNTVLSTPTNSSTSASTAADDSTSCSSNVSSLPGTLQQAYHTLSAMGLRPGVQCVVGDGLAVVDLGVFVQGKQIALELKQQEAAQSAAAAARNFALARVRERALQAHGWTIAYITEQEWQQAGHVSSSGGGGSGSSTQQQQQEGPGGLSIAEHKRMHYLLEVLKEAVGGQEHHHHHHDGKCGCH